MSEGLHIAVIPGDGVGRELLPACVDVLNELGVDHDITLLDAGFGTFEACGSALPETTFEAAREHDAIVFGAVSSPSGPAEGYASPILALRRRLGLYANLRPAVSAPVAGSRPDVDLLVVRENTEGLYSGRERTEDGGDTAIAERVITRRATERIVHRAFRQAVARGREEPRVTVVHKANVLRRTDGLFRAVALEVASEYPEVAVEEQLVDSMIYRLILEPERYDVIVAPNLYGDVISDAAAALVGGLGLAPSANVGDGHILVEPVHGSAPDIAGRGVANPVATLRAIALMLEHLNRQHAARRLARAVMESLERGPHTPDLGGGATTSEVLAAVRDRLHEDQR
jgi:homoisocitrate dehydrogenase